VIVYVQAADSAGKRRATFGMTRTGESSTVKKIIQSCIGMSNNAHLTLDKSQEMPEELLKLLTEDN
jgi:hypothetical protein